MRRSLYRLGAGRARPRWHGVVSWSMQSPLPTRRPPFDVPDPVLRVFSGRATSLVQPSIRSQPEKMLV